MLAAAFENRKDGDVEPAFLERDPITIFDDICALQDLIQMESELKETFAKNFENQIQLTLLQQIQNYYETQLTF